LFGAGEHSQSGWTQENKKIKTKRKKKDESSMKTTTDKPMFMTAILTAMTLACFAANTFAADEKVDITGEAKCSKCLLKETKECQNVIQADKDGKLTTYYLVDNDASREFHGKLCKASMKVKASGTVKVVDGKMQLTAEKIEPAN